MELQYSGSEFSGICENGLRLDDVIEIYPIEGKRRRIKMGRTCYQFCPRDQTKKKSWFIQLPFVEKANAHFELKLVYPKSYKKIRGGGRYYLSSQDETPFKLNGSWVRGGFIERGDTFWLGPNKIKALMTKAALATEELPFSQEIIQSDLPILLEGETGTGKTTLAKKIHQRSGRSGRFVHLNLSSFSEGLLESELFGHAKGAFTGASMSRKGAFAQAYGGTLFLDEIDSVSLDTQVKLLLFLESGVIRPVGSENTQLVKTRLIFASGQNLKSLVSGKLMREDFYYRIASGPTHILPALREEPSQITQFCTSYLESKGFHLSYELSKLYRAYYWPGNYRQIKMHLDKKMVLAGKPSRLDADETDEALYLDHSMVNIEGMTLPSLEEVKFRYISKVLRRCNGSVVLACHFLKISETTLRKYKNERKLLFSDDGVHIDSCDFTF